jgi:type IV pilus assembly protein PilM
VNYAGEAGRVVALVNAGASAVNINILSGGQSVFTRDVGIGGNAFTEAVQKELGLPFEAAEDAKKGIPVDGVRLEDVRPVLRAVIDNVLLEVEKTFDFYKATSSSDRIDRVVISGGASLVDGFAEAVRERLDTEVERFDPFRKVTLDSAKLQVGAAADYAPVCAVAVGLAMRKGGDR